MQEFLVASDIKSSTHSNSCLVNDVGTSRTVSDLLILFTASRKIRWQHYSRLQSMLTQSHVLHSPERH